MLSGRVVLVSILGDRQLLSSWALFCTLLESFLNLLEAYTKAYLGSSA
jgi:hypothetical protein